MNVSNRDVLIDYILGRLSQADAEAVEEQARVDSELAQTLGTLRRELSNVAALSSSHGLPRAFNRRLHDSSASAIHAARTEAENEDSSHEANERAKKASVASEISSIAEIETTPGEKTSESSSERSETDSWSSLFSDAFASFADENADAQEHAITRARVRAAKNSEIKPVSAVPSSNGRRLAQDSAPASLPDDDQFQSEETSAAVDKKTDEPISLYDVEVRTASQPIRRRKRFEFIPKKAQAPSSADASGFTFKQAVALSEKQTKKGRKSARVQASSPVLGERVVVSRASFDFVDSISDFSSYLDVDARVLRSRLTFNAPCSLVDDSSTFFLRGRSLSDGFFTRAAVETPDERAEKRFVVLPDVAQGSFALCRGITDSEKLDVDLLASSLATTFWTSRRVDVSNAYLVASLSYAPSTSDLELRRRVERILATKEASTIITEDAFELQTSKAAEYALPEIETTPTVVDAVPYPEAELAEETSEVEDSVLAQETEQATVSEIVPYPEAEFAEETSEVEDSVLEQREETTVSDSAPASESAISSVAADVPIVTEPAEETEANSTQVRSKFEYPVATFEVETPNSVAHEYVAHELAAPESKITQDSKPSVEQLVEASTVEELIDEAPTVEEPNEALLQNALIVPQQTDSYYASDDASVEDAEEFGPTLSAEDRRLAELLGHTPTPLELDEFYWEDLDATQKSKRSLAESSATIQLLGGVLYVVTAPVVLVGRATIAVGNLFMPRRKEQKALEASRSKSRKKSSRSDMFLDVAVPSIVGILIAIFVVFPFLLRSIDYAARSIGGNVFRRVTGKVAVPSVVEEQLEAAVSAKMLESQIGAQNSDATNSEGQVDANATQAPIE